MCVDQSRFAKIRASELQSRKHRADKGIKKLARIGIADKYEPATIVQSTSQAPISILSLAGLDSDNCVRRV
jgi:hypothetical protein